MNIHQLPLPAFLHAFQLALRNAQQIPDLQQSLAAYGYDLDKLIEGEALLNQLQTLDHAQLLAYDSKEATTGAATAVFEQADQLYALHRRLARRAIQKGSTGYRALRLNEHKAGRRDRWQQQATHFYSSVLGNSEMLDRLTKYGQTAVLLQQGQTAVNQYISLATKQQECKAIAEEATRARDIVWRQAVDWYGALLEVARFTLKEKPQLIEALKQVEYSPSPVTPPAVQPSEAESMNSAPLEIETSEPPLTTTVEPDPLVLNGQGEA